MPTLSTRITLSYVVYYIYRYFTFTVYYILGIKILTVLMWCKQSNNDGNKMIKNESISTCHSINVF